jgi:hypothetical protein
MKAIMRGGPYDGKVITLKKTQERIQFPVPDRGGFGMVIYCRTERLEGDDLVVFQ